MCGKNRRKYATDIDGLALARAGVIADSDWLAVEIRARASQTARTVAVAKRSVRFGRNASDSAKIVRILTHIRRYCAWKGLPYQQLDAAADEQYEEEAREELPPNWWVKVPDPTKSTR